MDEVRRKKRGSGREEGEGAEGQPAECGGHLGRGWGGGRRRCRPAPRREAAGGGAERSGGAGAERSGGRGGAASEVLPRSLDALRPVPGAERSAARGRPAETAPCGVSPGPAWSTQSWASWCRCSAGSSPR